jgi:ribosome biogenesis GTPase
MATDIATVFRKFTGRYDVHLDGRTLSCTVVGILRKNLVRSNDGRRVASVKELATNEPVAVGDQVRVQDLDNGSGLITEVLPRRSKLSRRAPGSRHVEQVMVANADQVVAVFAAAKPEPKWGLLDRYLIEAEAVELEATICITKSDLAEDTKPPAILDLERVGYPTIFTSTITMAGIAAMKEALQGKVSVFVGKSGVGKTSLLNALQPGLGAKVGEVSPSVGKGRHTTTHLEMFPLDFGGFVIDTPGIREFGLWDIAGSEMAALFREFQPHLDSCRFGASCSHAHEPGCAVREAVAGGTISERRYRSYLQLSGNNACQ